MLSGVGDESQEWEEWTGYALHIRRRLTDEEAEPIGEVLDIRGTPEARARAVRMGQEIERIPPDMLADELGVVRSI